jgi:ABC-type multidrug transport system fused ATPase/permease subunit
MVFVLFSLVHSGTFADVAGTITLYAYAGYRMIPAVQGLFKAMTKLKYGVPAAKRLLKEFALAKSAEPLSVQKREPLPYTRELTLSGIAFAYPGTNKDIFSDFSLTIPANSLVGFAGTTGSGKTTLIDIILGLLQPRAGSFSTDGVAITKENVRNWQVLLGYVPQSIYLSDNTIAANIAFGVSSGDIDMDAVRRAAKMAQIDEFIENELPQKYETTIGERGIRLSGGQRQRIGIARALYRNPSILIMDEATSALDGHTERAVMEAIDSLQGTRTIILIAHRLSTLKKCGAIYVMEKGTIVESGTYEQLEKTSPYFKSMSEKDAR